MPSLDKPTLKVLLGEYPKTKAIRDGEIKPELCNLDVADVKVANNAFKPLMRDLAFDFAEVAIMTFLIGREYGKPYALLPFVMNGGFHHGSLQYNTKLGEIQPKDLEGKRVGLRSWSQTTPTWVRGYLMDDYGVDLKKVEWVTYEDGHLEGFQDPPGVTRARPGGKLVDMLLDGELDAAMIGLGAPEDPRSRRLIPDPKAAARAWYEKHKAVPINHMVVIRQEILAERKDIVRELFDLLVQSRDIGGGSKIQDGIDLQPVGLDNVRNAVALACDYGFRQGLLKTKVTVDELFDDFTSSLGR